MPLAKCSLLRRRRTFSNIPYTPWELLLSPTFFPWSDIGRSYSEIVTTICSAMCNAVVSV